MSLAAPARASQAEPLPGRVTINTLSKESGLAWNIVRTVLVERGIRPLPVGKWVIPAADVARARAFMRQHVEMLASLGFVG